jgi:hypothetical protein
VDGGDAVDAAVTGVFHVQRQGPGRAGPSVGGPVRIGRERLRQLLHERGISFQRTRTWKESTDPDRDAKLDRIEYLRWRNAHARHPGVLAAQRSERARLRSERQQRWGRPKPKAA